LISILKSNYRKFFFLKYPYKAIKTLLIAYRKRDKTNWYEHPK
jgi:hypothetical protein